MSGEPEVPRGHWHCPWGCLPCPRPAAHGQGQWWHRDTGGTGTLVAQGSLSTSLKAVKEFAFVFAFPNCASGFPGTSAGLGFHGRFCAGRENRGRHKGATKDLPLTAIKGGRGALGPWGSPPALPGPRHGAPRPMPTGHGRSERCQGSSGDVLPTGLLRIFSLFFEI